MTEEHRTALYERYIARIDILWLPGILDEREFKSLSWDDFYCLLEQVIGEDMERGEEEPKGDINYGC